MIATSTRLQGISEYYFSQKLRAIDEMNKQGKQVLNLGIGSPDLPPHPSVIEVLQHESANPNHHAYQSYKGSAVLRTAISNWYQNWYQVQLNPDTEILPLMGSKEGIMHICMTYLNPGDIALIPNPGYPTYSSAVSLAGGNCLPYQLSETNQYEPNFEDIEKNNLQNVKLMFTNYPQMPTGQLPTLALFKKLVAFAQKHNILIVHDNPYSFILNENPLSLLTLEGAKNVVVELNSLSKSHNMAGWRVGMLCGAKQIIDDVLRFKTNMDSGMFLPVQLAAAKALSLGKAWYQQNNKVYAARREKVFELLQLLNCTFSKNQAGMFVWAKAPAAVSKIHPAHPLGNGGILSDQILNTSYVFITPGGIFGSAGSNYIRVSLCSPQEKLQQAITRIESNKTLLHINE